MRLAEKIKDKKVTPIHEKGSMNRISW